MTMKNNPLKFTAGIALAAAVFFAGGLGCGLALLRVHLEQVPTCAETVDAVWARTLKSCYTDCRMIIQGEP